MFKKLILLVCIAISLASCKKDEPAKTKTELITNKNWVQTAATVNPGVPINGTIVTDIYAQMNACQRDNILKFGNGNAVTFDEGAMKCNASSPQTTTGTWAFNSTETIVTLTQGTTTIELVVLQLDDNSFKYSVVEQYNGLNYTVTRLFTKQ